VDDDAFTPSAFAVEAERLGHRHGETGVGGHQVGLCVARDRGPFGRRGPPERLAVGLERRTKIGELHFLGGAKERGYRGLADRDPVARRLAPFDADHELAHLTHVVCGERGEKLAKLGYGAAGGRRRGASRSAVGGIDHGAERGVEIVLVELVLEILLERGAGDDFGIGHHARRGGLRGLCRGREPLRRRRLSLRRRRIARNFGRRSELEGEETVVHRRLLDGRLRGRGRLGTIEARGVFRGLRSIRHDARGGRRRSRGPLFGRRARAPRGRWGRRGRALRAGGRLSRVAM
jgi:hypothetical protein